MAAWPVLDQDQQQQKLQELTTTVLGALPTGWERLAIEYRQVGTQVDVRTGVTGADGETTVWAPPASAWHQFQDLRGGMYRDGEGTWFAARYVLESAEKFRIQYVTESDPGFREPLTADAVSAEQAEFPRTEANMPAWFRAKLPAATAIAA